MKKLIVMAMVLGLCLVGSLHGGEIEDAGSLLIGLTNLGVISSDQNATDMFIYVEPLWWKKQSHARKTALVKAGMVLAGGIVPPKEGVIVQDMTSKSTVAIGFIKRGTIKIYK
jgi:hypothetical protein